MKKIIASSFLLILVILLSSCQSKKNEKARIDKEIDSLENLAVIKTEEINSELEKLIGEEKEIIYKDSTLRVILVESRVQWNRSDSGLGTYAFDEQLNAVVLQANAFADGREDRSFRITEILPAKFEYFQQKEAISLSESLNKFNLDSEGKFTFKNVNYLDAKGKFNLLKEKAKTNYNYFEETIKTSNATIRYTWRVRGNNNILNQHTGRLIGGVEATLRFYEPPKVITNGTAILNKMNELQIYLNTIKEKIDLLSTQLPKD